MASPYSYSGGQPRCLAYWQEFSKCYASTDNPVKCKAPADDYVECLHRKKAIARAKAIQTEFVKKSAHIAQEGRKAADILADGVIVGVGLIQRDQGGEKPHS